MLRHLVLRRTAHTGWVSSAKVDSFVDFVVSLLVLQWCLFITFAYYVVGYSLLHWQPVV